MKTFCLLFVFWINGFAVTAQSINISTSAVPFLRISPDAIGGAMGDVGIATKPTANAVFWNAAKLPFSTEGSAVALNYTPWLRDVVTDVYLASVAGYRKLGTEQALNFSIRYFNLGNIQFTDLTGQLLSNFQPREFTIEGGYSRKLSTRLSAGVTLRYINSKLASGVINNQLYQAGSAVAGDLSVFYTRTNEGGKGSNFGLVISNLGSKISYTTDANKQDFIPANLGIGYSYTFVFNSRNNLLVGVDLNKQLVPVYTGNNTASSITDYHTQSVFSSWSKSFSDGSGTFSNAGIGVEYSYAQQMALRVGYFYEDPSRGNRQYITAGTGITYNDLTLNFSYLIPSGSGTTRNPLSNTIRLSMFFTVLKKRPVTNKDQKDKKTELVEPVDEEKTK